jgi:hypothetical protein
MENDFYECTEIPVQHSKLLSLHILVEGIKYFIMHHNTDHGLNDNNYLLMIF